ncbi:MAG: HDOD domain-containing protein [Burkholderiaceae bacterium]|nr:HDOD domain-containing protein [Burkholderiaceae bacterium]
MKFRILFVDDEPKILTGLGHTLRKMRGEWDMTFVDGSEKALQAIRQEPFDAVISDMRMPGMDGAALLIEVRRRNPGAVRIILSGYVDEERVIKTVGPAHQHLAKPIAPTKLVECIRRSLSLRRFLRNAKLRQLVGSIESLPTPPLLFSRVVAELERPTASAASISKIVANDPAMVAETLKLINSPFFGITTPVTDVATAVRLLGFERIRSLVLKVGLFRHFSGNWSVAKQLEAISAQSHNIGMLALAIARSEGMDERTLDEIHCAGLLSQLGAVVLLDDQPTGFRLATEKRESLGISFGEAQAHVFGAAQAELGAYLLGLWGFPDPIVESVAFCQRPMQCGAMPSRIVSILHFANAAIQLDGSPKLRGGAELDESYLTSSGYKGRIEKWSKVLNTVRANFKQ